jgi:hypothetical protein
MIGSILERLAGRPALWRAMVVVVGLVVAACNNSGGRPGY